MRPSDRSIDWGCSAFRRSSKRPLEETEGSAAQPGSNWDRLVKVKALCALRRMRLGAVANAAPQSVLACLGLDVAAVAGPRDGRARRLGRDDAVEAIGERDLPSRPAVGQQAAEPGERAAQGVTMHHHVHHAMGEEIFRALKAVRELLADGLLDDARARKTDQGTGLGDVDVAEHG